jgi:hypothetical protein
MSNNVVIIEMRARRKRAVWVIRNRPSIHGHDGVLRLGMSVEVPNRKRGQTRGKIIANMAALAKLLPQMQRAAEGNPWAARQSISVLVRQELTKRKIVSPALFKMPDSSRQRQPTGYPNEPETCA